MKIKRIILFPVLLILLAILVTLIINIFIPRVHENPPETAEEDQSPPKIEYGIIVDSLTLINEQVKKNQSLSDILDQYGVGPDVVYKLAQASSPVFDVRKIRSGNNYTMILSKDSIPQVYYLIYEEDLTSYIVFSMHDSISVYVRNKPVQTVIRYVSGTIKSSLWNSLADQGADPNLANELSEIYAWTIDFFGIQKDDYYRIIYEEMMVDSNSIGIGKVIAADFNNMKKDYYAFGFEQNGKYDYFDDQAGSLQRTFLKAPLKFKRISSKFSYSRYHPVLKIRRPHMGVDYAADIGTPVHTIGDGTVIAKGWDYKGGGNYIKIKHNGTYSTTYMHLNGFAKGISVGSRVRQGQLIGYVGRTGLATGPHLDFRIYRNGKPIDPLKVESPPAKPVDKVNIPAFNQMRDSLINVLKEIPIKSPNNISSTP